MWESVEEIISGAGGALLTTIPAVIEYERRLAASGSSGGPAGGLSQGQELLPVRCLHFTSAEPPPELEYIVCNELVGAAASWTPDPSYILTEPEGAAGPLTVGIAEQVQNLQHSLDRRGRAYHLR